MLRVAVPPSALRTPAAACPRPCAHLHRWAFNLIKRFMDLNYNAMQVDVSRAADACEDAGEAAVQRAEERARALMGRGGSGGGAAGKGRRLGEGRKAAAAAPAAGAPAAGVLPRLGAKPAVTHGDSGGAADAASAGSDAPSEGSDGDSGDSDGGDGGRVSSSEEGAVVALEGEMNAHADWAFMRWRALFGQLMVGMRCAHGSLILPPPFSLPGRCPPLLLAAVLAAALAALPAKPPSCTHLPRRA